MACRISSLARVAGPIMLALLTLAAASGARPAAAAPACGERASLLAHLAARFAEQPQSIGLSTDGGVLEVLAAAGGSWTILITYPKGPTCVIATGQAFETIGLLTAGQPAGAPSRTRRAMPYLPTTLTACAAVLLVLCAVAGSASAAPVARETQSSAHRTGLRQVAHSGGEPAAELPPEHPERFVRIAAFDWSKAVPEVCMQANLTIESALPFALKVIEIACEQFARSGIEIDRRRRTIAEVVPARGRLQVTALDLGPIHPQACSSSCRIVSVTPA